MIDAALTLLAGQLNQHFRRSFAVPEDLVVLSNLYDGAATPSTIAENKLVLFLTGIERDTAAHPADRRVSNAASLLQERPPIYLNLLLICAANFNGASYAEALKFLSGAITFFQGKPVFDHQNASEMDPRLERLALNIENLSYAEMNNLWAIHGGHYLPSVLYRVRMVALDSGQIDQRTVPAIAATVEVR